jgi:CubicO group peptidase (beta-lactamase class C family)
MLKEADHQRKKPLMWKKVVQYFALFIGFMLVCTCCTTAPLPSTAIALPSPTPQYDEHGVDLSRLELMTQVIEDLDLPADSVVVQRHGDLVFETYPNPAYGPDDLHLLYSVTKSFTSALIGIAIEQGHIESVDQQVIDFFPDWEIDNLDARKEDLTIKHLLTMTCGFAWEGPDDGLHSWGDALRSREPAKYVLNLPMASDPGTEWVYNGGCSHLLSAILTRTTGMSTLQFARENLFEPLGISHVRWPRDPQGIYFGGQDIWLTPRDMAKFGQLFLDQGVWEGQQLISSEWVADSGKTYITQWAGGYGYQWWTYSNSDIYYASGAFEQRIMVIPQYDMVVVFTSNERGADLGEGKWSESPPFVDWLLGRFILPANDSCATQTFAKYGFSIDLPEGMQSQEHGKSWQGNATELSGLIQFHYGGSPFESLGVQWDTLEVSPDLDASLDEFASTLGAIGVEFHQLGERSTKLIGEHETLYQAFEVEEGDDSYSGFIGAWYCIENQRPFIFYLSTTPTLAQEQDLSWQFFSIIESFNCDV